MSANFEHTANSELLVRIDAYCRRAGIKESTFGKRAVNDGKLVGRLRAGQTITLETLRRVEAALATAVPSRAA